MEIALLINLILVVAGFGMILAEILLGLDSLFDLVLSGLALLVGGAIGLFSGSAFVGLGISIVLVISYWVIGRRYVRNRLAVPHQRTNVEKVEGQTGKVVRIKNNGDYVVKIDGEEWTAESAADLQVGSEIKVAEVRGTSLLIKQK